MARTDLATSLILIALGLGVLAESLRMPRYESLGINPYTVPGIVPGALGVILALFGAIMLVRTLRTRGAAQAAPPPSAEAHPVRLALAIAATLGYGFVLVGWLPFRWATFLFVTGFIVLFESRARQRTRSIARIVGFAVVEGAVVALAVGFVFERIFLVRLP
ncbi:MAG: tripartite tricarboxylate transporter TctB family protein [Trueperaceae bacterium]|nr:tripartite tricarboxylate transporter TctB family protein [Trueperaceae bacterium]